LPTRACYLASPSQVGKLDLLEEINDKGSIFMYTDPIADLLTRIRNGLAAGHRHVEIPSSRLKQHIVEVLLKEGYIQSYELKESPGLSYKLLRVVLKYDRKGFPVIRQVKRVSRPGMRRYFKAGTMPRVLKGAGIAIVSTNKGLMTDRQARRDNIGGELICTVY
jgi:small subunit ribosomal protein S8